VCASSPLRSWRKHAAKLKGEGLAWVEVHSHLEYATRAAYGRVRTILREPNEQEKGQISALDTRKKEIEAQRQTLRATRIALQSCRIWRTC